MAVVRNLESHHPGMVVFAGPFDIQAADEAKRERELLACAAMKKEFKAARVQVSVVLTGLGAWVLRAKDGLQTPDSVRLEKYALQHQHQGSKRGGQWA